MLLGRLVCRYREKLDSVVLLQPCPDRIVRHVFSVSIVTFSYSGFFLILTITAPIECPDIASRFSREEEVHVLHYVSYVDTQTYSDKVSCV